MIILSGKDSKKLVDDCTAGIDHLLKRLHESDGITKKDYEAFHKLDDIIIEYEDLRRSYEKFKRAYDNLLKKKRVDNALQTNNQRLTEV